MYSLLYLLMLISSGSTPVHFASSCGHVGIIDQLLQHGGLLLINMATHPYTGLLIMVVSE